MDKSRHHKDLNEPFPVEDIEWRIQQSGEKNGKPWAMVLAYVTNRAIMERLDSTFGMYNWKNEFTAGPNGGLLCGISIRKEGTTEWITKWDGADNTQIESVKGGLSSAMKRCAVQWGIGRYLYNLDVTFAKFNPQGKHSAKIGGSYHRWDAPSLPEWALPKAHLSAEQKHDIVSLMDSANGEVDTLFYNNIINKLDNNDINLTNHQQTINYIKKTISGGK